MKFNYSLFIGLLVASQMAQGSAAAAAPTKSAITETASNKRLRFRCAWYKVLSQVRNKKLELYQHEADVGSEVAQLQRRNGELGVIAMQVHIKEELLQQQRAANKQLRVDLAIAASNLKKLEAVNKKLNETIAAELQKKLDDEHKKTVRLEKEKVLLLKRLATYSPRAKEVNLSLKSGASESPAAAEDLP